MATLPEILFQLAILCAIMFIGGGMCLGNSKPDGKGVKFMTYFVVIFLFLTVSCLIGSGITYILNNAVNIK